MDRIADMRINDMNAVLQAVRQMVLMQQGETENDLYLRTLELAQIQEDEYFGHVISDDLKLILRDIRAVSYTHLDVYKRQIVLPKAIPAPSPANPPLCLEASRIALAV